MTSNVKILFICCNENIRTTVLRLINAREGQEASAAADAQEAMNLFACRNFDLVLFGSGLPEDTEKYLRNAFEQMKPEVKLADHYGGGSGLLWNEIEYALRH